MRISFLVSVIVPRGPISPRYPILPQGPLGTIVATSLASLWLLGEMKSYDVVCVGGAWGWGSGVSELGLHVGHLPPCFTQSLALNSSACSSVVMTGH